jgi:flagellar basal-body rod protein FlgF
MIRGLYISATGMSTQLRNQEVVSNNLANVDTVGYKKDKMVVRSFQEFLASRIDDPQDKGRAPFIGRFSLGSAPDSIVTDYSLGTTTYTGRTLDVALAGEGFFTVATPQGERFTRAGDFQLSADGALQTVEGYPVLGEAGPIEVGDGEFYFTSRGDVVVNGESVNRFAIVDIPPGGLIKEGETLFVPAQEGETVPLADYTLYQGYLESSNVNAVKEMVDMIAGMRAYEMNQRSMSMQDETLGQLINDTMRG